MNERLYFSQLASELGIQGAGMPPMPGDGMAGPPQPMDAHPMTHPNVWRKEGGEKLLAWLKDHYHPGDVLEYDGHADCWLMLAMMDQMKQCRIQAYIGAEFDKTLV